MKALKRIYKRLFGEIKYVVTVLQVGGSVHKFNFKSLAEVDEFVSDCNGERYDQVQRIEKIRVFDFIYKGEVLQSPLWFNIDGITEEDFIGKQAYSFVIKDSSLACVKRVKSKAVNEGTSEEVNINSKQTFKI